MTAHIKSRLGHAATSYVRHKDGLAAPPRERIGDFCAELLPFFFARGFFQHVVGLDAFIDVAVERR